MVCKHAVCEARGFLRHAAALNAKKVSPLERCLISQFHLASLSAVSRGGQAALNFPCHALLAYDLQPFYNTWRVPKWESAPATELCEPFVSHYDREEAPWR